MNDDKSPLEIPFREKLKGIPGFFGIRFDRDSLYQVERAEGGKEIRKYRPLILATITVKGSFEEARVEAFDCLTGYIFGQNKEHIQLKRISPVLQEETIDQTTLVSPFLQESNGNGWTMSFVLPVSYTLASAPTPLDKRIFLQKNPERMVAAYRYSGNNDPDKIKKYSLELMEWINKDETYALTGDIQLAFYDTAPTISFLKRNEIHLEIKPL